MIKPPHCCDCGAELKSRKSIRCKSCALKKRHGNIYWKPEDNSTIIVYAGLCEQIKSLSIQLAEKKKQAKELRKTLLKNHASCTISRKITYLVQTGVIKKGNRTRLRLEANA